jgi:hypothetical protein
MASIAANVKNSAVVRFSRTRLAGPCTACRRTLNRQLLTWIFSTALRARCGRSDRLGLVHHEALACGAKFKRPRDQRSGW